MQIWSRKTSNFGPNEAHRADGEGDVVVGEVQLLERAPLVH